MASVGNGGDWIPNSGNSVPGAMQFTWKSRGNGIDFGLLMGMEWEIGILS